MLLPNSGIESRRGLFLPGALLLILAALLMFAGERLEYLESAYYDFLQRTQFSSGSDQILVIDTKPDTEGGSLWHGTLLSPLIDSIHAAGAAVIVPVEAPPAESPMLDIDQLTALAKLENRARNSDGNSTGENTMPINDQLAKLREQYAHQAKLASVVKASGNIVLPISDHGSIRSGGPSGVCQQHSLPAASDLARQAVLMIKETSGLLTLPDTLCEGAAEAGYGEYWPDSDGVVRRAHLLVKSGTQVFPALSLAAAHANRAGNAQDDSGLVLDGLYDISVDNQRIKTGSEFTSLIRFYHSKNGTQAFPTISASDLLNGEAPGDLLKDRIVLIGDMQVANSTAYRTPFGEHVPPVLLLATALSNLLQMDFLLRPHWLGSAEIAILFILGIAILFSAPFMNNNRAAMIIGILVVLLLAIEAYLLLAHGVWIQLVTATLFVVLGLASVQAMSRFGVKTSTPRAVAPARARVAPLESEDQLDLAFSVLRQQPPNEVTKKRLYGIAVTHGKLKEYSKAERVLVYLAAIDPNYRDVSEKLKKLSGARKKPPEKTQGGPVVMPADVKSHESTDTRKTLGRYRLDKVIGKGAMATIYLGMDPSINRQVAIKTIALAEEFSDSDLEAAKAQFKREAESAGRLNHPNIISIYDTGEDDNVAYLAMEYFEGKALNYYAQPANLLPPKWVLELCARAADALHYAHGQGVVHRDIKPANLMYNAASDSMKITDFGIARLTDTSRTKTGIILGTPSYMSPEQLSASAVTGKSDLYSLGITMYQLLTGTTPFRSDSIPKLMDKIINSKHTAVSSLRDDVPLCVDVVLDQLLAKNPDDRYPNGRALALALRDCCNSFEGQ